MMVGIILVHLRELHIASDDRFGDLHLDNSAVCVYLDCIRSLVQHIAFRSNDFADHIFTVGYILNAKQPSSAETVGH